MTRITSTILALALTAVVGCGRSAAPHREATDDEVRGTAGQEGGPITVTGCLALGQMGTYMLTSEAEAPREQGLGRAAATTGYQLLGQPADFNEHMNKRVRVTGVLTDESRAAADSEPTGPRDPRVTTPWPKLQVREVEAIGGDCPTK
jgi:hypothetical protein